MVIKTLKEPFGFLKMVSNNKEEKRCKYQEKIPKIVYLLYILPELLRKKSHIFLKTPKPQI